MVNPKGEEVGPVLEQVVGDDSKANETAVHAVAHGEGERIDTLKVGTVLGEGVCDGCAADDTAEHAIAHGGTKCEGGVGAKQAL